MGRVRLAEASNQLVRFTTLPWVPFRKHVKCKNNKEHCKCHSTTPEWCFLPRGCEEVSHDSSFYMMTNSTYDKFIATEESGFEYQVFAAFDSMLVTPPLTLQAHFA